MTEFYDGRDGWSNGDSLYADPTGELWTPKVRDAGRPTLRRLADSSATAKSVSLTGWRSFMLILGDWRGAVHLTADGFAMQAPLSEVASWTDVSLPGSDWGRGPISDGLLKDEPEFIEHWEAKCAEKWAKLRSPGWIAEWEAPA